MLGRQYAQALAAARAHVVVADIDARAAQLLAAKVSEESGIRALAIETDVSSKLSVQSAVSQTMEEFGRVDGLVNNAALDAKLDSDHAGIHALPFEDYPLDLWEKSLAVNVTGMFLFAQAVARPMLAQESGSIVNISSTYGLVGPDQRVYEKDDASALASIKPPDYSVTKAAVLGLTRYLATYWAGKGVRVNTLSPGGVFDGHDQDFVRRYNARTPLGRMAEKSEYCGALLFLLSDASSYMTGGNLVVDGGWTAW